MTTRGSLVSIGILAVVTSLIVPAEENGLSEELQVRLMDDWVEERDGWFMVERYALCEISLPAALGGGTPFRSFQASILSEAPAEGLLSRDHFVAISVRMMTEARATIAGSIPGMTVKQAYDALRCRSELHPAKERNDYELEIRMTLQGVETALTDNALITVTKVNQSWPDIVARMPEIVGGAD